MTTVLELPAITDQIIHTELREACYLCHGRWMEVMLSRLSLAVLSVCPFVLL